MLFESYHTSWTGSYKYGGKTYPSSASPSGSGLDRCIEMALKALKINETTCTHMKCTFGGIWNGGGGDGQKSLFVASFFFDRAAEVQNYLSSVVHKKCAHAS